MIYKTKGTCSQFIDVEVTDGRITHCQFIGGCQGNTQGVARLVQGMTPEEVIHRLRGIQCGSRGTSCPDQLCHALEQLEAQK